MEMAILLLRFPVRVSMRVFMALFGSLALGMNCDVVAVRVHAEPE